MQSVVPPPRQHADQGSNFNRSEFEIFSHHTTSAALTGEAQIDRLLEWVTNPKFKAERVRFSKMKTMGKKGVELNISGGVMQKEL